MSGRRPERFAPLHQRERHGTKAQTTRERTLELLAKDKLTLEDVVALLPESVGATSGNPVKIRETAARGVLSALVQAGEARRWGSSYMLPKGDSE